MRLGFLKQFIKSPGTTGAIVASSNELAEIIISAAELTGVHSIVEFGCGTGVFTHKIMEKKSPDTVFFAIELNTTFAEATRRRCPSARVINDSAIHTRKYLQEVGLQHCERVICGLPWASFPEMIQDELLDTIKSILAPGGIFVTFAYLQGLLLPAGQRFRKKLRGNFVEVTTTRTVWVNLPPAFVYKARI